MRRWLVLSPSGCHQVTFLATGPRPERSRIGRWIRRCLCLPLARRCWPPGVVRLLVGIHRGCTALAVAVLPVAVAVLIPMATGGGHPASGATLRSALIATSRHHHRRRLTLTGRSLLCRGLLACWVLGLRSPIHANFDGGLFDD